MTESKSGARLSGSFLAGPRALIEAIADAIRFRKTLTKLEELDDHMLRDIGLSRSDLFDLRLASSAAETFATLRRLHLYR
jgi:uncharacterized protein YjiS (DUF1127 family)